jgi:hypothetical protein
MSQHEMQRTPFYYFAFTYRFSYGEGRRQALRAREDLKN